MTVPDPSIVDLLNIAVEAVDRASRLLLTHRPTSVTMKSERNPVTEVDMAIERDVREFLRDRAPTVGFLGEETGRSGEGFDLRWALDPVDGTVNLMHGLPLTAVSLGLSRQDVGVLGVIEAPFLGKRYTAVQGSGAFRNDESITVSNERLLENALVSIGDYAVGPEAGAKNDLRFALTQRLVGKVRRIRMLGSAALDLAWVAEGALTASVTLANKPWDSLAGTVIAREAGAAVVDHRGASHSLRSSSTIACSPNLADKVVAVVQDSMRDVGSLH